MPNLFQKSVEKKYPNEIKADTPKEKFVKFQDHFRKLEIQQNIRGLKEVSYQEGFVKVLLKKGANIYTTIDPHSKSDLLDHVCTDASLFDIQYSGLLKDKPSKNNLKDKNIHHMLNSLVATASCTRMYKCLMGYE